MQVLRGAPVIFIVTVFLLGCNDSEEKFPEDDLQKMRVVIEELTLQGRDMAKGLDTVAHFYETILAKKDSILKDSPPNPYRFNGAFSTNLPGQDSSLSSVIILNSSSDRQKAEKEVLLTNSLDEVFAGFIKDNPMAVQIYSNSVMQVSRVYPAYDARNIVDANIDVTGFNFFYEADSAHNPSKSLVWIPEPYVDPAGKGWILSLVRPVYDEDRLFAVIGVDFTVSEIIQRYLDSAEGQLILVNSHGDIVAGKADAIESLSMPPLKNHVYRETIRSDYFRISDFNLFSSKSREVRKMAQRFLLEKKDKFEFKEEVKLNYASCVPFEPIGWFLIKISPDY